MKPCAAFEETLVLDAHGELAPDDRREWERHLDGCRDCAQERERLRVLIRDAKAALAVPALTSEEEQRLSAAVQRTLRTHAPETRSKRAAWWLAPAFAACMVLVVAGWFGLKNYSGHSSAVDPEPVPAKITRAAAERPGTRGPAVASVSPARVPERIIGTAEELPGNPAPDTAAVSPGPAPEEIMRANKELLENLDLLKQMDELEQLVNLLDKQEQGSARLRTGGNGDHASAFV